MTNNKEISNSANILVEILKNRQAKITFAESCTAGLMASSLVEIPGASEIFECGFVAYSPKAKNEMIDVKYSTINNFGIVSNEVAYEMVKGAAIRCNASVGISVTGCAGPGMDSEGNKPGTLCFGFYLFGKIITEKILIEGKSRQDVRKQAVKYAFNFLIQELNGMDNNI